MTLLLRRFLAPARVEPEEQQQRQPCNTQGRSNNNDNSNGTPASLSLAGSRYLPSHLHSHPGYPAEAAPSDPIVAGAARCARHLKHPPTQHLCAETRLSASIKGPLLYAMSGKPMGSDSWQTTTLITTGS